jgi:hypothetical protein
MRFLAPFSAEASTSLCHHEDSEGARNMFKILLATGAVLIVFGSMSLGQQPPKKYVEAITIDEFLRLPSDFQVMYVAGISDGFTYVMRNYDIPGYEEFAPVFAVFHWGSPLKR